MTAPALPGSDPVAPVRVEDIARTPGFCALSTLAAAGVQVDLRYAGTDNVAGRVLYGGWDCAWLRREAADGLRSAARFLARLQPDLRLCVLDALRPQRVQESLWRDVAGTPGEAYFAHPARGSIHSWGMAVDVTLVDAAGQPLDMGSAFDEMHERSHPELHAQLLARGWLQPVHVQRRDWLRQAMQAGGFAGIPNEWWHFDHGDRDTVRRTLPRVI